MSISISAPNNRLYLAGPPEDEDFMAYSRLLQAREWNVRNTPEDNGRDLRHQLGLLLECQAICMLPTWWTSYNSNVLQLVAGWTHTRFIEAATGEVLTNG